MFFKSTRQADQLWEKGIQLLHKREYQSGIDLLAQAIESYEKNKALEKAAECAEELAVILTKLGDSDGVLHFLQYTISLKRKLGSNVRGEATTWGNWGKTYLMMDHADEALLCLQEALRLFRQLQDRRGEAETLINLGNIYIKSDRKIAIDYHESAVRLAKKFNLSGVLIAGLTTLGSLYGNTGDLAKAAATLQEAINRLESLSLDERSSLEIVASDHDDFQLMLLENLSRVYLRLQDNAKALQYCELGLLRARQAHDNANFTKFTALLSAIHQQSGKIDLAVEHMQNAVRALRDTSDDPIELVRYMGQLALLYHQFGDLDQSLSTYEEVIRIASNVRDPEVHIQLKGNLGLLYRDLGQFTTAMTCFEEALQFSRAFGAKESEAWQLGNLGLIYQQMKDHSRALQYFKAALRVQEEIGDEEGQSYQLGNIGQVALELDNPQAALQYFSRALELSIKLASPRGQVLALGYLGAAYMVLGEYDKAIDHLNQAREGARAIGDQNSEAIQLAHLGSVYEVINNQGKALAAWNAAIELSELVANPNLIYSLRNARGSLHQELGQIQEAYSDLKAAIAQLEFMRGQIAGEESKLMFLSDIETSIVFMRLITLLSDNFNRYHEAYEYVRRAKAQVFADSVSQLNVRPPDEVPIHFQHTEEQLVRRFRELQRDLGLSQSASERNWILVNMETTEQELTNVRNAISEFSPEYISWRQAKTLSLEQLHNALDTQDKNVTLVEFYVLLDKVLMFVLRSDDPDLHALEAPIGMDRLGHCLRASQNEINEHLLLPLKETWHELSNDLLMPLIPYLDGCELLCVVPNMQLHYLPIHALMLDGARLIEHVPIVYLPTSRLMEAWQKQPKHRSNECLAVGYTSNDEEPLIMEEEAQRVADILGGKIYVGSQATTIAIKEESAQYPYLHISCHGYFDEKDGLNSGLELADGQLTVRDIVELDLDADLVVLSGCETGRNIHMYSDDSVGFVRSFLFAGADTVLVSLWSVHGESTFELMKRFYKNIKEGHSKAVALQKAEIDLKNDPRFSHPYYWAPFILIGDWR